MEDSYNKIFSEVQKVLVILAHPDDAEVSSGGLIARLAADGKSVSIMTSTNGGKGMRDMENYSEEELASERMGELENGATNLGAKEFGTLGFADGQVENTYENIGIFVKAIRTFKPDVVITHNPKDYIIEYSKTSAWVNHRDHRNTGQMVLDACYPYSRDRGFFPEHFEVGLKSHEVNKIMFTDAYQNPNRLMFETTNFQEDKRSAIMAHKSQFSPGSVQGLLDECKFGNKYFEGFSYWEIY